MMMINRTMMVMIKIKKKMVVLSEKKTVKLRMMTFQKMMENIEHLQISPKKS